MGLFKSKSNENWKINYIKEFNEMRSNYERKLRDKDKEIVELKNEIEDLKLIKSNLRPKERQIRDKDISNIKKLKEKGLSYREISQETSWSKATICRVINGAYD